MLLAKEGGSKESFGENRRPRLTDIQTKLP